MQPIGIPARPKSMLDNKHDTIKRMSSLPRRKQEQAKPTTNDRPRTPKDPNVIQITKEQYSRLKASEEKLAAEVEDLKSRCLQFIQFVCCLYNMSLNIIKHFEKHP